MGFRLFLKQDNGLGASQMSQPQCGLCSLTALLVWAQVMTGLVPLPPEPVGDAGLVAVATSKRGKAGLEKGCPGSSV